MVMRYRTNSVFNFSYFLKMTFKITSKLVFGSNNVQNDCVVLLVVLTFTPPHLECKGIKILLMCKEKLIFFLLKRYELI